MSTTQSKHSFFRQSGWMIIATSLMGFFMYAVHIFARRMPDAEYGVFVTLLQALNMMGIPAIGLQSVFAQQAAAAISEAQEKQLKAALRVVLQGTFLIWFVIAGVILFWLKEFVALLQIANPAALLVTVLIGLAALWFPIWSGLLQGRQNFLWLGWATIANGVGRFLAVAVIVLLMGGYAAGAMTGALIGIIIALSIGAWRNSDLLRGERASFDWRGWLSRVVPLTLGLGVGMFMLSFDMIVVQILFPKEKTGFYGAAGMIGRALVFFTIPLTYVMFPKIVHSAARADKTSVLAQALGATAILGGLAALGCTLLPWLPLKIVYGNKYLSIAPLVPWFAWCMLPLTLANVLLNNLMARAQYEAVPWLIVVAAGYATALTKFNDSFETVVKTLGVFGLILLGVSAWFTWGKNPKPNVPELRSNGKSQ